MMTTAVIASLLVVALGVVGPEPAPAPIPEPAPTTEPTVEPTAPPEPDVDHARIAGQLFSEGRFAEAAAAFQRAFEATRDPAFLFGRAQALRRAGNCHAAIDQFEVFIALDPPARDVAEARAVIDECEEILQISPAAPAPTAAPEAVNDPVAPPSDGDAGAPTPWHRDVAGGVLLGTGLAFGIAGGALLGVAHARGGDSPGETESDHESRRQQIRAMAAGGIVMLAGSGALLIASALRYTAVAKGWGRAEARSARVRFVPTPMGAAAVGRF